jgi:hypothetical protein
MYKPLHLPLIEALPEKLLADRQAKLGQLSIYEQEQQAIAEVLELPLSGGEASILRTVQEATIYNHSRRIPQQRQPIPPELPDYGGAS